MPGDKVNIGASHITKANTLFPRLFDLLEPIFTANAYSRAVVTVCGGSGVGKSEIASLLSFYLANMGIGSYTLSGDNYPHMITSTDQQTKYAYFMEKLIHNTHVVPVNLRTLPTF
jgi:alpha-galactosidase